MQQKFGPEARVEEMVPEIDPEVEGGRLSARDPQATFSFAKKENLLATADEVEEEIFGEGQ